MNDCPCGSGRDFAACCAPVIAGTQAAATAEQLMRARYSAHVKVAIDFIFASTHPEHREGFGHEETRAWAEKSTWYGLEILDTNGGGAQDEEGEVHFVARFRDDSGLRSHHERARFKRQGGQWFFTGGEMVKPAPLSVSKIGRNDPCSCGSGQKYKKCCGK